jgi:XTP/dITP diphosphohydrolase
MLGPDFAVTDLTGRTDVPEVEESGGTFEQNAILKAVTISRLLPELVVADDSGLEVDALGGAPGVYSARYVGARATDADNVMKLLHELESVPDESERGARFRCVVAVARRGSVLRVFNGVVRGVITRAPVGSHGFGYDPVFKPAGADRTFAELGEATKNAISHRARAVADLQAALRGDLL